jgi:hypothetical protein
LDPSWLLLVGYVILFVLFQLHEHPARALTEEERLDIRRALCAIVAESDTEREIGVAGITVAQVTALLSATEPKHRRA